MQMEILSHWGVIEAVGDDAATFLQSQLTQDVASLSPQQATLAAYCTAKGRMLGQFVVIRDAARYLLLTHRDMADALVKRLGMFVLRSKCKLRNASSEFQVLGCKGTIDAGLLAGHGLNALSLPLQPWACAKTDGAYAVGWPSADGAARHLLVVPAQPAQAASPEGAAATDADAAALHGTGWQHDDILCGIPFLEPANLEAFVPQMVNLDVIGGVSFSKGCYPGQEIVARAHYLGKAKRRMQIGQTPVAVNAGADVFASTRPSEPAGRVVNAAPTASGSCVLLFEISSDDLADSTLHVQSHDGPLLQLKPLPYDIPAPKTPPGR